MSIFTNDLIRRRIALEFAQMQVRCDCLMKKTETERNRLLARAKAGQPSIWRRFLLRAGDVLITSGLWLKSRCQPALAPPALETSWQR